MNQLRKLFSAAALTLWAVPAMQAVTVPATTGPGIIQFSDLEGLDKITFFEGEHVVANLSTNSNPITIMGTVYESGVGTHAPSVAIIELNGATSFHSILGVDDEADLKPDHGIVDYIVTLYGDSKTATTTVCSGTFNRQTSSYSYTLDIPDLSGYKYLKLEYGKGAQAWADHADWADARFTYSGTAPRFVTESEMFVEGGGETDPGVVNLPTEASTEGAQIIPLSSLDLSLCANGWGTIKANKSIDGKPITINGVKYTSGVGMHASGSVVVKLNGATTKFHAVIGNDDEVASYCTTSNGYSRVAYDVILRDAAGKETSMKSGIISVLDPEAVTIDLDGLTEYKYLIIRFDNYNGDSYDHVDLGNAYFEYLYQNSNAPEMVSESVLETNLFAATTVFSQPGVKFMQKLRCQADEAEITVKDLPEGLTFNEERCLVEGVINEEGVYHYTVVIKTGEGSNETQVTLTVSSNLQQPTPFMGWISWNVVQGEISNSVIETVSDAMANSGLRDAGYNYLVIDDLWHASSRKSDGTPVENASKFPKGMKAAADYVHSKGMKFGIYSDAASKTCAGAYGSIGYETKDANQYAAWGVDLLKYDYCGAPADVATAKTRYKTMGDALKASGRDILFYICEWGVREPWKWGSEVGGTCWRATYDTRDCWNGATGGIGILQSIAEMKNIWPYNGVNRWNDADMMCVGIHGTGKSSSDLCASGAGMTMDEYGTQFALWCMWSSPLTLSFDLRKPISDADLALLTNPELIAINQDRMGQAAELIEETSNFVVFAKDLENGDVALSVTNLSSVKRSYTFDFSAIPALNVNDTYLVRDVVNHADLDAATGSIKCDNIAKHATVVYRLTKKEESGINEVTASKALDGMTAVAENSGVRVCLPGTDGVAKRLLISDLEGRVVANANGVDECYTLSVPAKGIYVVNAVCAGRSHSLKLTI